MVYQQKYEAPNCLWQWHANECNWEDSETECELCLCMALSQHNQKFSIDTQVLSIAVCNSHTFIFKGINMNWAVTPCCFHQSWSNCSDKTSNWYFDGLNVECYDCLFLFLGWVTHKSAWKVPSLRRRIHWPKRLRNLSSSTASENLWVRKRFSTERFLTSSFRLSTL